jgi:hypothetical protein
VVSSDGNMLRRNFSSSVEAWWRLGATEGPLGQYEWPMKRNSVLSPQPARLSGCGRLARLRVPRKGAEQGQSKISDGPQNSDCHDLEPRDRSAASYPQHSELRTRARLASPHMRSPGRPRRRLAALARHVGGPAAPVAPKSASLQATTGAPAAAATTAPDALADLDMPGIVERYRRDGCTPPCHR